KTVRGLDERYCGGEQRLGLVDASLPGLELPAYAAPQELGRDVAGRGEVLAYRGELGRLVIPALPVQDVGEQARRSGDVVALAHLLQTPVVRAQLRFGGGQIAGQQLDGG